MPSHILTVYRPALPSEELIAKKQNAKKLNLSKKSDELEILKFLNTLEPKPEHIISLIDSFQTRTTSWVILPKLRTLGFHDIYCDEIQNNVPQICYDFIKGVAYLHKLCIAHRDIKLDNLLVDRNFCVKIIDFDIAIRVKDENEEIVDQRGTEEWLAPEILNNWAYSPIKADRWSSGRVILYLCVIKKHKLLETIRRNLMTPFPDRRPSMLEVAASLSYVAKFS